MEKTTGSLDSYLKCKSRVPEANSGLQYNVKDR